MKNKTSQTNNPAFSRSRFHIFKYLSLSAIVLMLGVNGVMGQVTLANYQFENNLTVDGGAIGSPSLTFSITPAYNAGVSGSALSTGTGANANGAFVELTISTIGYTSVTIGWAARTSNAGTPGAWVLTGNSGSGFGSSIGSISTLTTTFASTGNIILGSAFDNNSSIVLRITSNNSGLRNLRIDDLIIRGTVSASAPTVTTTAATSITTTSATLAGNITASGGATPTASGVVYALNSTNANPQIAGTGVTNLATSGPVVTSGNYSLPTGSILTANSVYSQNAYATNTNGTGYGTVSTFTTLSLAPTIGSGSGATQNSFTANWSAPASQGAATFTYSIDVDDDINFGSINFTQSSIVSGTTTANVNTGLSAGITYYYRVRAVNAGGNSAYSSTSVGYATLAATVSGAPTIGTATAGNASATVAYTAPVSNGGSAITTYTATSNPGNITGTLSQAGSGTITVNGLTNGTPYTFTVTATNGVGTSSASVASNSITPAITYTTPTYTNLCSSNDFINNFSINTLSNLGSGCNGNANNYINYAPSGLNTTSLYQNTTYSASVTIGSGGSGNVGIWIDYNDNGTFETSERSVNATLISSSGTQVITVAVPVNATIGSHRMRVREVYSTSLAVVDPTSNASYGETEDYTITILAINTPPTLTAAGGATVDAPFNVTFVDDATWRAAITSITVGGVTLNAGSAVSAGQITFTPSASTPTTLLQSSGSKSIVVIATGYSNATVTQSLGVGVATKLGITTQPTAPATNGAVLAAQPVVVIRDQYNNLTTSTATVTAAVGAGAWTLGGTTDRAATSGTATFSGLTATSAAAVTGATITFTSAGLTDITSNTFNIIAPPVAPTVTTPTSASIVNTTATLGGNVTSNGGATITARGVVWSVNATNSNPTIGGGGVTNVVGAGTTGTFTINATDLPTNTLIAYRAYATNSVGTTYTTATTFTTLSVATKLVFGVAPTGTGNVGVNLTTFTVQAQRADNSIDAEYVANVTIARNVVSGSATLGGTTTVAAVAGTATFSAAQFDAVGTYTITASSAALATATSGNIVVSVAPVVVYNEDFGINSNTTLPYSYGTNATGSAILNSNLTAPSWSQSLSNGQLAGNTNGAMSASNISSTYTITCTVPVVAGYQMTPTSISFDSRITSTGPTTLNISISGSGGGSTSISSYTLDRGNSFVTVSPQSFTNTSLNLTGTVTITFSYSGSGGGNARLDNVFLNGIVSATSTVTLSNTNLAQYVTQNITRGNTNVQVSRFQVDVTDGASALNSLSFTTPNNGTTNSYVGGTDINNFKLWSGTTTDFASAVQRGSQQTSVNNNPSAGETVTFSGLALSLPVNTYYFWITADVLNTATSGRTLTLNAPTLTLASGSTTGSIAATGTQTVNAIATNYYLNVGGSVTTAANYFTSPDGVGTTLSAAGLSHTSNDVILNIPVAVTNSSDFTLGNGSKIVVQNGGSLTVGVANTITGTIDVNDGGSITFNNTSIPTTLGTLGATSSTVVYSAAGAQAIQNKTYANLTITGSGTKTLPSSLSVNGNLALTAGTLADAGFTLTLGGNITGTGTHSGAGKILMTTASSTISAATLGNLELNNASGFSLSGSPIINGALTLTSGKLNIGANTLTLAGTVSGMSASNCLVTNNAATNSNLVVNGNLGGSVFFDQTNDANRSSSKGTNALADLTIGTSGNIVLGNKLNLFGALDFGSGNGTLSSGDGLLVFRNTASSTARLAAVAGTPTFTGAVVVENHINHNVATARGWRLLSSPLTSAGTGGNITPSVQSNWQSAMGYGGNYGTNFYSPSGLNGMDGVTNRHSLLRFRADTLTVGGWTNINTTGVDLFNADAQNASTSTNPVFFAFVRGDKSVSAVMNSGTPQSFVATTLASKGRITFGNKTVNLTGNNNGYAAVGNPFISPVDANSLTFTNIQSNNSIYVWDPTLGSTGLGGYATLTGADNYATNGNMTKNLQTGQAFLVQLNGTSGSVVFEETDKVSNFSTSATGAGNGLKDIFSTKLHFVNSDGSKLLADAHRLIFGVGYTKPFNIAEDAPKFANGGENLSSKIGSNLLSVDVRPYIQNDDSIFMSFTNTRVANYEFEFDPSNFDATVLDAKLVDKFLNTETPLSLSAKTTVPFSVTATTGSNAADRFMIVFRGTGALPNKGFAVAGEKLGTNKVKVNWEAQAETGVREYALEKSTDGVNYQTVNTQAAKNGNVANSYTYTDNNPVNGVNYYRVKTTQHNDIERYSTVITVNFKQQSTNNVTVYPNPVKGNTIGLQLQDLEKGMYSVRILSLEGKEVYKQQLQVNGSSLNTTINPSTKLAQGTYTLQVVGKSTTYTQKVVVE